MKRSVFVGGAFTIGVVLFALAARHWVVERNVDPAAATPPTTSATTEEAHPSLLYGRIITIDGVNYEGRLRWGRDEEAFWGNDFNGVKKQNPWVTHVPPERLHERRPLKIFGFEVAQRERRIDLGRPFMARFGDITRIEARGRDVRVTLKSGTVFDLDRFSASDFDDDVRVWDGGRGVVDLDSLRIRAIEFLSSPGLGVDPHRLHGTVRTRQGEFTGFVQWNREACLGRDTLDGHAADGEISLRFDTIRSIARRSHESSLVTLVDGREIVLSDTPEAGAGNRGVYVDDPRYGRVLVSWNAFDRIDFSPGGTGPAYGDFPTGGPLTGSVTTRDGRLLSGRLVVDLDESEVTETLDAPSQGVDYTIPFGLIASIAIPRPGECGSQPTTVTLHTGEALRLECTGDLSQTNAGLLVFVDGRPRPEYVPWTDVEQVDLNRPRAMYPPLGR